MTPPFGVSVTSPKTMGGQDTSQLLQKILFGRVVGSPGIPYGGIVGEVVKMKDGLVVVTIQLPNNQTLTYHCIQPVSGFGDPPAGTRCFVVFPANEDHTPWVTAFSGWPS